MDKERQDLPGKAGYGTPIGQNRGETANPRASSGAGYGTPIKPLASPSIVGKSSLGESSRRKIREPVRVHSHPKQCNIQALPESGGDGFISQGGSLWWELYPDTNDDDEPYNNIRALAGNVNFANESPVTLTPPLSEGSYEIYMATNSDGSHGAPTIRSGMGGVTDENGTSVFLGTISRPGGPGTDWVITGGKGPGQLTALMTFMNNKIAWVLV